MKRLPFVLWLVLWPLFSTVGDYVHNITSGPFAPPHSTGAHLIGSLFSLCLYIYVAVLLWKDGRRLTS